MQEKARIAAAIQILDEVYEGRPADKAVSAWGRTHRFAGSKDRRAISAYVYDILRNCWRLNAVAPDGSARGLMLAHVRGEDLAALFDGEGHGPAALSEAEQAWAAADVPALEEAATHNLPDFLFGPLQAQFGDELPAVLAGFEGRAPVDLRVNVLKTTRDDVVASTGGVALELSPHAVRVEGDVNPALLKDGLVEPQDVGSQHVADKVQVEPGQQVVDFCAGGGGKTLAMAAAMQNKGQIYAYDALAGRMKALKKRLERAKVRNAQIHTDYDELKRITEGRAHRVLVDAPCSGTGAWRRNPETRWRLDEATLAKTVALQAEILDKAAPLVKPGGTLTYVTCSFLAVENDAQAQAFLARNKGFEVGEEAPVQLLPHLNDSDGFYIASFRRKD
ncbi:MAG: RsmB/NOP family class I SAM-dependent RNA methyltransferase [Alphaproteobacteria bacterium]